MLPTLKNGQIIFIKKYNLNLKYGDIIVIKKNDKIIIKRLIGLPNENIEIINNYFYINGKKYKDLYIENQGDINSKIYLNSKEYFVLGDNSQNSIDSRFNEIGIIYENEIQGKVILNKGEI